MKTTLKATLNNIYHTEIEKLDDRTIKYRVQAEGKTLTYQEVIDKWQTDEEFTLYFNQILADAPFSAFFWETPGIQKSTSKNRENTVERPFEFVITDSPILERAKSDKEPFEAFFDSKTNREVVAFDNLGGDALLVVPCPIGFETNYTHIANFVRDASPTQITAVWKQVGKSIVERLENGNNENPIWISTCGFGVYWLHIRLDSRPKYYRYEPYKKL